ncbi:non-histone chromosomal protein HMG-14 [Sigmodon hispidus]
MELRRLSPSKGLRGCRPSPPQQRWTGSRKRPGKDKKSRQKGRGAKGKQAGVADQQTTDVPAENGEAENQSPASEVEEKETKSD